MAENLKLAKALRQAEMRPTPRSGMTGMLADALMGARNFADRAKVPDFVPLIGGEGVGSLLVGKAPEEINELSYGNSPIQMNPYAGRTASFVPEMKRGRGQQLADALSLLSLPGGKTAASMMMGAVPGVDAAMFIGPKAKTWDAAAAARAVEMEKAGVPARSIWSETGTLRGPDGLLRQEISDDAARMNLGALPRFAGTDAQSGKVANVLQNKPLDAAYPDLGMVDLSASPAKMTSASYMQGGRLIPENIALNRPTRFSLRDEIPGQKEVTKESLTDPWFLQNFGGDQAKLDAWTNQQLTEIARKEDYLKRGYAPDRGAKSDLLHELQHAIQQREGFARGGSPNVMGVGYESDLARLSKVKNQVEKARNQASSEAASAIANDPALVKAAQAHSAKLGEFYASRPIETQVQDYILSKAPGYARAYKELGELQQSVRIDPTERYRRLAGEAEARATQARMNMTPAERRATFPYESYDVPLNQLIVR